MHAITIVTKMDVQKYSLQRKVLEERIVPLAQSQPGFVSGTWTYDRASGRAWSLVVFDSEENAARLEAIVREGAKVPSPGEFGVEIESIWMGEVQAQARR
jgi:hypothetical protein